MSEQIRVDNLSDWYINQQLDFDKRLIRYRFRTLEPHLKGHEGLELGPAEGEMTTFLKDHFARLTVVDGAADLLSRIPNSPNVIKVHALFEDFQPSGRFDTIVLEHVLEHVAEPVELLRRVQTWLAPGARLLLGVPNGQSIHRLVAVKMGLLKQPCELNERDLALGHRRVYTPQTLRLDVESAGLEVSELGGVFFKPLSNGQMQQQWTDQMIEGFYELGKDFPDHAAELYAVCRVP